MGNYRAARLERVAFRQAQAIAATVGGLQHRGEYGVALVVLGDAILGLFGPGFAGGFAPMVILIGGHCVAVAAGSVGFLLVMTGHQREAAAAMGAVVVLNVVLNALLIPRFGAQGAAWALLSAAL